MPGDGRANVAAELWSRGTYGPAAFLYRTGTDLVGGIWSCVYEGFVAERF